MVVPVPASLPDSTLAPSDVAAKFQSTSLMGLGGLGTDEANPSVDLCTLYPAVCDASGQYIGSDPAMPPISTTDSSAGSNGAGTDWAAVLSQLIKSGVDVTKLAIVQPGTTQSASGAISRQNPGYAIPNTSTASLGINAGGIGTSTMLLGLGALALIFMTMNANKGGR